MAKRGNAIRTRPASERFMELVDPEPNTGCWLWRGVGTKGYGLFSIQSRQPKMRAHRAALLLFRGIALPKGHAVEVDHRCRQTWCVNPDHLDVVTPLENTRRKIAARQR